MRQLLTLTLLALTAPALAAPEYRTITLEIDVARPAAEVWAKVGGYCDISKWLNIDCTLSSGDGGVGTVRSLAGGRVLEVLVGRTDLSYGYAMAPREGQHYDMYHGFLEVKPVTDETSRIVYTLMYDVTDKPDKDADIARRRAMFEGALQKMKQLAEE